MQVLNSLKILDLTDGNPYITSIFADYGATVLHIEMPGKGDSMRKRGGLSGEDGPYYSFYGRNKLSMTLDYTKPEGMEVLKKLVKEYDMLAINKPESYLAGYGLSFEDAKKIKPDFVYGVLTPYGETGPWKDQPDYDLLVMSKGGLQEKTGFPEKPTKFGSPLGYLYASWHLSAGMLAAYLKAMTTGEGTKVSTSTWHVIFSLDDTFAECMQGINTLPARLGNGFPTVNPTDTFKCKNGWFSLSIGSDDQWLSFAHSAGVNLWWEDERYAHDPARSMDNYFGDLDNQLREFFAGITIEEADRICQEAVVPGGPCNGVKELFEDNPQVETRNMLVKVGDEIQVGKPAKYDSFGPEENNLTPAHALGEDTMSVLAELKYSEADINALRAAQIV